MVSVESSPKLGLVGEAVDRIVFPGTVQIDIDYRSAPWRDVLQQAHTQTHVDKQRHMSAHEHVLTQEQAHIQRAHTQTEINGATTTTTTQRPAKSQVHTHTHAQLHHHTQRHTHISHRQNYLAAVYSTIHSDARLSRIVVQGVFHVLGYRCFGHPVSCYEKRTITT